MVLAHHHSATIDICSRYLWRNLLYEDFGKHPPSLCEFSTYLVSVEKADFSSTVHGQVLHFVDPVVLDSFAVGLFELVAPQMVVIDAGLDVGDQQEAGKGKAGDDKPTGGLHRDSNERGAVVADDEVVDLELVKEEPAGLFTSCRRQLMFCLRFFPLPLD